MDRRYYESLDGLRGLAALTVVIVHTPQYWGAPLPHGFLAVDLFFCLSGFVLTSAYKEQLSTKTLPLRIFLLIRVIRLYPVLLLGMLMAGLISLIGVLLHHNRGRAIEMEYLFASISGLFLIPYKISDTNGLFPLNGAMWSLFFEILANILIGALAPTLSRRIVIIMLLVIASGLTIACLTHTGINFGANWDVTSIVGGFARSLYGMLIGAVIWFFHDTPAVKSRERLLLFPAAVIIFLATCFSPSLEGVYEKTFQLAAVLFIMPFVVYSAVASNIKSFKSIMVFAGATSYPLYVTHGFVIHLFGVFRKFTINQYEILDGIAILLVTIIAAYLIDVYYDIPVRHKLRALLLQQSSASKSG